MTHRHEWTATPDGWACVECGETSATCRVCSRASGCSLLICDGCASAVGAVLRGIRSALELWQPTPLATLQATRYDRDVVHGQGTGTDDRLPFGITLDEPHPGIVHAADVVGIIWDWVEMWREVSGIPDELPPLESLRSHVMWAVHNPEKSAWDDWLREMRSLRHHARRLAGLLPRREHGPCIHCGGEVVRDWAERDWTPRADGLSDEARCTGCGMTWGNYGAWKFAQKHTIRLLPHAEPDMLVTLEEARAILPDVPAATLRSWMLRDREAGERGEERAVPERGWDERGVPTYRLGDLHALATRRTEDGRKGRRAAC